MNEEVYVIEVNPRSSRTVPYISKVTGIPIVDLATKVIIGNTIRGLGYEPGLAPVADYIAIKMPVFSFEKLRGAEISLGPEMKSTGECLGIAKTFNEALYKAFLGAGVQLPKYKQMIMTVKDADKPELSVWQSVLRHSATKSTQHEALQSICRSTASMHCVSIRFRRSHQM